MRFQRAMLALGAVGVLMTLGALVIWGGVEVSHAAAQPQQTTPEPPTPVPPTPVPVAHVVEPVELNQTVTTDWGTFTVSVWELYGIAEQASGGSGGGSTQTAPTTADIQRLVGFADITFDPDNPEGHTIRYHKVERRLVSSMDPNPGWRVVHPRLTRRAFTDHDMIPSQVYQYKVTSYGTHAITGLPVQIGPGLLTHTARPQTFLGAIATDGVVWLEVRSESASDWQDQAVTITRFDHMEMTSTGTVVVDRQVLQGPHMKFPDTTAPAGMFIYRMDMFFIDGENQFTPTYFSPATAVVDTVTMAPTTPSAPDVRSLGTPGMENPLTVIWTITGSNRQAAAYEVQRRMMFPQVEENWSPMGTVVATTPGDGRYFLPLERPRLCTKAR